MSINHFKVAYRLNIYNDQQVNDSDFKSKTLDGLNL